MSSLNCSDSHGASPLHLSVLNGHLDVAKFLAENGSQVATTDDRGMTPLHYAIAHIACITFLLEQGAEVDQGDNLGASALAYAVKNECLESVRYLILKGADPVMEDSRGVTPMSVASVTVKNIINEALRQKESTMDSETQKTIPKSCESFQ